MSDVSERVSGWEADGKDLPILVKHYLKLGGKTLAFSVDPKFSDVLDALLMVDLRASDPVLLTKYLGKSGAHAFVPATPVCLVSRRIVYSQLLLEIETPESTVNART